MKPKLPRQASTYRLISACIKHKWGKDVLPELQPILIFILGLQGRGIPKKVTCLNRLKYWQSNLRWFYHQHLVAWMNEGCPGFEWPKRPKKSPRNIPGWARVRYEVLCERGLRCELCGNSPAKDPNLTLHVDHIKPYSTHPELGLEKTNLRVLCGLCNIGRSNKPMTQK